MASLEDKFLFDKGIKEQRICRKLLTCCSDDSILDLDALGVEDPQPHLDVAPGHARLTTPLKLCQVEEHIMY